MLIEAPTTSLIQQSDPNNKDIRGGLLVIYKTTVYNQFNLLKSALFKA